MTTNSFYGPDVQDSVERH